MKSPVKCIITTDTKSFNKDGVIHFQLDNLNRGEVESFIRHRNLRPGSVVLVQITDKESKSYKQLKTVHLLLKIYMASDLSGAKHINELKNRVKYQYGESEYFETKDKKIVASLKSFADYKMSELAKVITGLFDEMNVTFAEAGYSDRQFSEMIIEFNGKQIKEVRKVFELF